MATNCYVILGVCSDATQDEIKSAYRRQAREHHPDHSGAGSEPFLRVRDAYEVLSDPQRRRAHDEELARERNRGRRAAGLRRPPIEALDPSPARDWSQPLSSLFQEMFGEPWRETPVRAEPEPATGEMHTRVSLTARQALQGGQLRIWVPVEMRCPACRGWGGDGFFACRSCSGSGILVAEQAIDVAFPAGVYDGFTGSVPLTGELSLVIHFHVRDG